MAVVVAVTSDMPPPQIIEELFTYWNLDDADATLEELEDALIVSGGAEGGAAAAAAAHLALKPLS